MLHIKNFLSGVFKFAKQEGVLDGINPITDISVPGKPTKFKGAAYTLDDVERMLEDLQEEKDPTAGEVLALLGFTGLHRVNAGIAVGGLGRGKADVDDLPIGVEHEGWRYKECS